MGVGGPAAPPTGGLHTCRIYKKAQIMQNFSEIALHKSLQSFTSLNSSQIERFNKESAELHSSSSYAVTDCGSCGCFDL